MAELGLPRTSAADAAVKWLPFVVGSTVAVAVGTALGYPAPGGFLLLGGLGAVAVLLLATLRPLLGFYALVFSTMLFLVVVVRPPRGLNAFDVLLLPVLVVSFWGSARRDEARQAAAETGAGHVAIRSATSKFQHAILLYFAVAAFSLVPGLFSGRAAQSLDSGLMLMRVVQGALLFPLAIWWLDSERRIHQTIDVMVLGGAALLTVNVVLIATQGLRRAGMGWFLNQPKEPIGGPNEAATSMLFLTTLLLARNAIRPRIRNWLVIAGSVVMLILTLSRSGIVAWTTFVLLRIRRIGWRRALVGMALVAALVPLLPHSYLERMGRSMVLARGTFERYSIVVRLYGYETAWKVFLDHPLFGVGYQSYRFVSERYNDLRFVMITTENFLLETATGMGLVGLGAVALVVVRIYGLGRAILRTVPPGSLAHHLAEYHGALMTGLFAASFTGSVFVGLVAVAQLALWTAILVRSGHQSLREATA